MKLRVTVAGSLAVALAFGSLIIIDVAVPTPPTAGAAVNGFTA